MHCITLPTHPDVQIFLNADEVTIFSLHPKPDTDATYLQEHSYTLKTVVTHEQTEGLSTKSTLTLITPENTTHIQLSHSETHPNLTPILPQHLQ